MALINIKSKQIYCKIVYYGSPSAGKLTNLLYIYHHSSFITKSSLYRPPEEGFSKLYFEILPDNSFLNIKGFKIIFCVSTISGAVLYQYPLIDVLSGVDGVVFVVDSQKRNLQLNLDMMQSLAINITKQPLTLRKKITQVLQHKNKIFKEARTLENTPVILQYNKRDLSDILPVSVLDTHLNTFQWNHHEAIATTGLGVRETFQSICKSVVDKL